MKWAFLRGHKTRYRFNNISDITDMWERLACELTVPEDQMKIMYWGENYEHYYGDNIKVERIFRLENSRYKPDVIFARGGFPEYEPFLRQNKHAIKIYYGAGTRTTPPSKGYDIVLTDMEKDGCKIAQKYKMSRVVQWAKPAIDDLFKPLSTDKKYDICFIANGQQAEIKRIKWVYKHLPRDLSLLHLGFPSKYDAPSNVTCGHVESLRMPEHINRCRVGIVPYKGFDSAPRAMCEMAACGLMIFTLPDVRYNEEAFSGIAYRAGKDDIFSCIRDILYGGTDNTREKYESQMSMKNAVKQIRKLVSECKRRN